MFKQGYNVSFYMQVQILKTSGCIYPLYPLYMHLLILSAINNRSRSILAATQLLITNLHVILLADAHPLIVSAG
jgi:hypothetical protein